MSLVATPNYKQYNILSPQKSAFRPPLFSYSNPSVLYLKQTLTDQVSEPLKHHSFLWSWHFGAKSFAGIQNGFRACETLFRFLGLRSFKVFGLALLLQL